MVLDRARAGSVAVLAGAARVGSDYAGASQRARTHYEALDASVAVVPDPREDLDAALEALGTDIGLIVLPGGSPSGLLDVLTGPVGDRLVQLHSTGTSVSGASAGAMVLCASTALPDRRDGPGTAPALGLVPGLALPHWTPGSERRWPVPDVLLWGLPECGGALIDGDETIAVGEGEPAQRIDGAWRPLPRR